MGGNAGVGSLVQNYQCPLLTLTDCSSQVMFVLFTVITILWSTMVIRARPNSHRIHYLMIVLCVFKALTLLSQAGMYHLIRAVGHAEGWSVAFYFFTFIRGILFFTVCHKYIHTPPFHERLYRTACLRDTNLSVNILG